MAKEMKDKTLDELAMEMYTKTDSLPHLMAEAEITRRVTEAQLEATRATVETATPQNETLTTCWRLSSLH